MKTLAGKPVGDTGYGLMGKLNIWSITTLHID